MDKTIEEFAKFIGAVVMLFGMIAALFAAPMVILAGIVWLFEK